MANSDSITHGARFKDITGKAFGTLTVVECVGKNRDGRILWRCVCECGNEKIATGKSLRQGETSRCKQCKSRKHGMSNSAEYQIWAGILYRCTNPNSKHREHYRDRGIEVCDRWKSFEAFFEDMGPKPFPGASVGRINNDGNYEPNNCRWETWHQQNRNTRQNVMLTYKTETLCITDWAERIGISFGVIRSRLALGWSVEKTFETPVEHRTTRQSHASITHDGNTMSLREWSNHLNIDYFTLLNRMRRGWSVDRVLSEPVRS